MGAISHAKPEEANAQPQTDSRADQPTPLRHQNSSILLLIVSSVFSKFVFVLEEFVIGKFQLNQELLGVLHGFYQEFLVQPGSSWVNQ